MCEKSVVCHLINVTHLTPPKAINRRELEKKIFCMHIIWDLDFLKRNFNVHNDYKYYKYSFTNFLSDYKITLWRKNY